MKHVLLTTSFLLLAVISFSQITVTQADYGQAGDSIVVGYDNAPPASLSVGGTGNQTWDFTSLSLSNINTLNFVDPANTASGNEFPNADLAIERLSDTLFFESTTSSFVIDGFSGTGFGLPINIVADFEPNSTQIEFPSTLGSTFVDTAVFDTTVNCAEFGFGSTCDSARLKRVLIGSSNVDGYGDLSTPGGNFTTIRQYFREDNKDTVWIKIPFFGWTMFLDSASTEHNYRWIANGEKWPVLSARADGQGGDIVQAEYVVGSQVLGYASFEQNPWCAGECSGSAGVGAVGGLPPYSYAWPGGQTTQNVTGLCAGTYLVTITDSDTGSYEVTVELQDPAEVTISGAVQGVSIGGDGAIDIYVTGGTGAYTYAWTGPDGFTASSQDIGNLEVGEYTVDVSDANGCDTSRTFLVELTGLAALPAGGFQLFPNPADDQIQLRSATQMLRASVRDMLGNNVRDVQINDQRASVSILDLSAGVYFLEVQTEQGTFLRKFTVKH